MRIYRNRRAERFVAGSAWLAQRLPLPRGLGYEFFAMANPRRARRSRIQLQPLEEPEPAPGAEVMNVICLPR